MYKKSRALRRTTEVIGIGSGKLFTADTYSIAMIKSDTYDQGKKGRRIRTRRI